MDHPALALTLLCQHNPPLLYRLLAAHPDPAAAWLARADWGLSGDPSAEVARWRPWLARHGWQLVLSTDSGYPELLHSLPDAPGMLFVQGNLQALSQPQLAIVGARSASPDGLRWARELAAGLAAAGFTVTSGLARGIDGAAHQGALAAGGTTVALMASGPQQIYPREHQALARQLVERGGALVTEFPPGVRPLRHHFPLRNRLISALSLGVVVVQALRASGSLVTARHAAQQGRTVFAVPGVPGAPLSAGPHQLLREGAVLLESLDDIAAELPDFQQLAAGASSLLETDTGVLALLAEGPRDFDQLLAVWQDGEAALADALLEQELAGRVRRSTGRYQRIF